MKFTLPRLVFAGAITLGAGVYAAPATNSYALNARGGTFGEGELGAYARDVGLLGRGEVKHNLYSRWEDDEDIHARINWGSIAKGAGKIAKGALKLVFKRELGEELDDRSEVYARGVSDGLEARKITLGGIGRTIGKIAKGAANLVFGRGLEEEGREVFRREDKQEFFARDGVLLYGSDELD